MVTKVIVSLSDAASEALQKSLELSELAIDIRYDQLLKRGDASPERPAAEELVSRSERRWLTSRLPVALELEGATGDEITIALLNAWGVDAVVRHFPLTANRAVEWEIEKEAITALRATSPAEPADEAPRHFKRRAKLIPVGGSPPNFASSSLSVATVPDGFAPGELGLPAEGPGSVLIDTARVSELQPFHWNETKLGVDGAFEARFPQSSAKGWLWWLSSSVQVVGFVPESLDKPHRDQAALSLPPFPEPATPEGGAEPAGHGPAVPADPSEIEIAENPQIYAEDPGAFCKPFSNPERVLSERSFHVIVRVTQPEISPRPSRKIKKQVFVHPDLLGASAGTGASPGMIARLHPGLADVALDRLPVRSLPPPEYVDEVDTMPVGRRRLSAEHPVQWEDDIAQYQASSIALGHLIEYRIRWRSNGYSLGKVVSSLTLAPRQVKRVQKIQFERLERERREESTIFAEDVSDTVDSSREYDNQVAATLSEWSSGSSYSKAKAGAVGAGFALPGFVIGGGATATSAESGSEASGSRTTTASEMQRLTDSIRRHGDSLRKFESTVVTEVSQAEIVTGTSEVVRNFNYGHSLTIIYHQILRHLKVTTEFGGVRQCLFIPFALSPFTVARALRWRESLERHLRDERFRPTIAHLRDVATNFANSKIMPGKRSIQPLTSLRGSLYVTMRIERPADGAEDAFDAAKWLPIARLTGAPTYSIWAKLARLERAARDARFQQEDAPAVAAKWIDKLLLQAGTQSLDADFTMASSYGYGRQLRVDFNVRSVSGLNRDLIKAMTVSTKSENMLTPGSGVMVDRAVVRYGTARFRKGLNSEPGRDDLIAPETGEPDPQGAALEFPLDPEWDDVDEQQEIRNSVGELVEHLNEHVEHYHKAIWWNMDRDRLLMMLDGFYVPWASDVSVASVVEREPLTIVGNSIVYTVSPAMFLRMNPQDSRAALHNRYATDKPISDPLHISLPTDGLYAQSVLDECGALEEHRGSTDWVLDQPDIDPESVDASLLGSRRAEPGGATTPTSLPASIINLHNAPGAPPPSGLEGVLGAVANANAFRDMAGLAGTQANAAAAMQTAAALATNFGNQAAALRLAKQAADAQKAKNANEKIAAVEGAKRKDLIGPEESKEHTNKILEQLHSDPADESGFGQGGVFSDVLRQGAKMPGTQVEATTPSGQLKMTLATWPPPVTTVGWQTPNGLVRLAQVQQAIVDAARAEVANWRNGGVRREGEPDQFGHLVRYWLGGIDSRIRPNALADLQAAAIDPATSYGDLLIPAPPVPPAPPALKPEADIATAAAAVAPALLASVGGAAQPDLGARVRTALGWARNSFEDHNGPPPLDARGPWSAVFVTSVVRQAAMALGIEREDPVAGHVGADELLMASQRHRSYTAEAYSRSRQPGRGGYHAFRVGSRQVQPGDIIVQDRRGGIAAANVTNFDDIPGLTGRALHGDIVVKVEADHCVAIGGNLGNSVMFRFYPIRNGLLRLMWNEEYVDRDSDEPVPQVPVGNALDQDDVLSPRSTWRIFALLGLVEPYTTEQPDPFAGVPGTMPA
jgi:hypothetical protein